MDTTIYIQQYFAVVQVKYIPVNISLPNPCIRCATELDSFRGYWRYRNFVILLLLLLLLLLFILHFLSLDVVNAAVVIILVKL